MEVREFLTGIVKNHRMSTLLLPSPRIPDPSDAPVMRWGILAPGLIAGLFAEGLRKHTRQRITAVGSRTLSRAESFATQYEVAKAYGNYAELVADPEVDVVYVASPHSEHREHALMAISAGKHVLVEKAFTRNAAEAGEVIAAAKAAGVLVLEAMWTRFLPHIDVVRQLLNDGALGDVTTVLADHGQWFANDAGSRLFNPALAGGALLDLGIYPVSFASFALGTPASIVATGKLAFTGVDGQVSAILSAADGAQALVNTTLFAKTPTTATIVGTEARIEIAGDFYAPSRVSLISRHGRRAEWDANVIRGHEGLCFQASALARLVAEGATESPLMPLSETLSILQTTDEIRRQLGVRYPKE
jgi:predicted dehydrogenase